jgi:hypothetical protein
MGILKSLLGIGIACGIGLTVQAQSVDEILNKHFEALGGKEKIRSIKSLSVESDVEVMGNKAPMITHIVDGKAFKNTVTMNGSDIIQVLTDTSGWMINPMMGTTDPTPMPKEQFESSKSQIYIAGPLFDYAAKGYKVELDGKEGNLLKLKVSGSTPFTSIFFIDPATNYVSKATVSGNIQGQQMEITSTFSDYRKTDFGYVMPYQASVDYGNIQIATTVKKVDFNKEIDPKIFQPGN